MPALTVIAANIILTHTIDHTQMKLINGSPSAWYTEDA